MICLVCCGGSGVALSGSVWVGGTGFYGPATVRHRSRQRVAGQATPLGWTPQMARLTDRGESNGARRGRLQGFTEFTGNSQGHRGFNDFAVFSKVQSLRGFTVCGAP